MFFLSVILLCSFTFSKCNIFSEDILEDVLNNQNEEISHAYTFGSGVGNREELVISSITSDDSFDIGEEVNKWQTINLRDKIYAVGLMSKGVTIFSAILNEDKTLFDPSTKIINFQKEPTAFTLYKVWSREAGKFYVILLVALIGDKNVLQWYHIREDNDLDEIGFWHLKKNVTHLKIFEAGDYKKLLVINEGSETLPATLDIYNFALERNYSNFWLLQTVLLECSAETSAVNEFGENIFLTIPQVSANKVLILHYINNEFVIYQNITSQQVNHVTDFRIGYKSFLAVGGYDFAIYRFTTTGLVKEELIDTNFEEVTYFLPVPVKTYRDEVMLLVQHHINYTSHVSPHVKVLIYSKGSFIEHDEIPCTHFGQKSHGATCLADLDRDVGVFGSAVLSIDKVLGVIVPMHEAPSGVFYFDWKLEKITNPVLQQMEEILKARIGVEKMLQEQHATISEIKRKLSHSLQRNKMNEITAPWHVNIIQTPEAIYENTQKPEKVQSKYSESKYRKNELPVENTDFNFTEDVEPIKLRVIAARSVDTPKDYVIENLRIDGSLEVQGSAEVRQLNLKKLNGEVFDDLVKDCVRKNEKAVIKGTKTIMEANIENISFKTLNNKDAKNILTTSTQRIQIKGNLTFANTLNVKTNVTFFDGGKVNNLALKDELIYMNTDTVYKDIHFENIQAENLTVKYLNGKETKNSSAYEINTKDGLNIELSSLNISKVNINAEYVNNQEFNDFARSLCLTTSECYVPGNTTIKGRLHIHGSAEIETLNWLKYPEEFLLSSPSKFTKITGRKKFTGKLSVGEIIADGLVDGIDPDVIVTLSKNETIPANFTFSDLEISESLNVDGSILLGPNLTKFLPNPTLEDIRVLDASAIFTKLEVEGSVTVENSFAGTTLENLLEDIVYKDEEKVTIIGQKNFEGTVTVDNNLVVESNSVNDLNISEILTIDTDQIIPESKLTGKLIIENLEVKGLYNGENLTKIFEDLIWLDRDETVKAEIVFENDNNVPDISATELVVESINGMNKSQFYFTEGNRTLHDVQFGKIKAENVIFLKDLKYGIECFDIKEYDETRFSLTKDQIITGEMVVTNGVVDDILSGMINDFQWKFVKEYLNISNDLHEKLFSSQFKMNNLRVKGSLHVKHMNKHDMKKLLKNVFWLDRTNKLNTDIEFEEGIKVKSLAVEQLNGEKFKDFLDDVVLKNATNPILKGQKIFENGFTVLGDMNVDELNNLRVEDILLRSEKQDIFGNIVVHGDVRIDGDLNVNGYVNDVSVKYLKEHFHMRSDNTYVLKGNVTFSTDVSIDKLYVEGLVNDVTPVDFLDNIVGIYDHVIINGTTIFKKKVHIKKNLGVATTIDGVDLEEFMNDVVFITSDNYIQGLVTFAEDVVVADMIEVETDLDSEYVFGCKIQDWIDNAVDIYSGYLPGQLEFENITVQSNLEVDFINDFDMSTTIPLHIDQTINRTLEFNFVTTDNDIQVGHLVNGYNLEKEFENTVLISEDQSIESEVIFSGPVTVQSNLKTTGLVNGKDLRYLVTTDTDQTLSASYVFDGKVSIDSDLHVTGKVNDINVTDWQRKLVYADGDEAQDITDIWEAAGNITFQEDVTGNGLLGGLNISEVVEKAAYRQREKYQIEKTLQNDYRNICLSVQDMLKLGKNQIFLFKYLEEYQKLIFSDQIGTLHHFNHANRNFLIVSQNEKCYSYLYEWIHNSFELIAEIETGDVDQFITIKFFDRVYLLTRHDNSITCAGIGVNLWIFKENSFIHVRTLAHSSVLQFSKLAGTFYGLNEEGVTEYRLFYEDEETAVHEYRKWRIPASNYTFNQHEQRLGLSLRDEQSVLKLSRAKEHFEPRYKSSPITGEFSVEANHHLPPAHSGELVVMEVGAPGDLLRLTAVTIWQEASVKEMMDDIKIYEDVNTGKLFHKISATRPSNLNVLDFGHTGETILAFLENFNTLKLYEFKGVEGFKYRSSAKIEASKMITLSLPLAPYQSERKFLLLVQENSVILLQAVMDGDRPVGDFYCDV